MAAAILIAVQTTMARSPLRRREVVARCSGYPAGTGPSRLQWDVTTALATTLSIARVCT